MKTLKNDCKIQLIKYHPSFGVICLVSNSPFHGTMDIVFNPQESLLEFESFEAWLKILVLKEFTVESFCRLVFDELSKALGDIPLCVTVHARTTVHAPVSATIERKQQNEKS